MSASQTEILHKGKHQEYVKAVDTITYTGTRYVSSLLGSLLCASSLLIIIQVDYQQLSGTIEGYMVRGIGTTLGQQPYLSRTDVAYQLIALCTAVYLLLSPIRTQQPP